jgi:hypothetical protein
MAHFAEVENGTVLRVIVAEQDFIDSGAVGDPSRWVQCSYNTRGGVHIAGGTPLRKNYPGPGWTYDAVRDAFYEPQPYPSWTLDKDSCTWKPPVPCPEGFYGWDEESLSWVSRA